MLLIGAWAIFRTFPTKGRYGPAIDTLCVIAALFGLGWPLAQGEAFLYRAANPTGGDMLAGLAAIAVVLEITRRTTGWILPISGLAFLGYAIAGPWLPSIGLTGIAHRGYDLPRLVGNLYMTLEGIYGVPLDVAASYIILFSIYGAVLEKSGAGQFFLDFAMSLSRRGNPAKSAGRSVTLAGFLLGTVSGSGVATTVTLGSVAWPVMRRVGFAADTAGAMLAASGIGALLSPPTLGAAAFLIAEYLRISYLDVLVMATIPTALYYLSIALMIEGESAVAVGSGRRVQGSAFASAVPGSPQQGTENPEPGARTRHPEPLSTLRVSGPCRGPDGVGHDPVSCCVLVNPRCRRRELCHVPRVVADAAAAGRGARLGRPRCAVSHRHNRCRRHHRRRGDADGPRPQGRRPDCRDGRRVIDPYRRLRGAGGVDSRSRGARDRVLHHLGGDGRARADHRGRRAGGGAHVHLLLRSAVGSEPANGP